MNSLDTFKIITFKFFVRTIKANAAVANVNKDARIMIVLVIPSKMLSN